MLNLLDKEPFWVAVGALCSLLVAVATYALALQTRRGLDFAREQMRTEQERHMDSLLPHIALHVTLDIQENEVANKQTFQVVIARNIGLAFAQHVQVSQPDIANVGDYIADPLTSLRPGDEFVIASQEFHPEGPHLHDITVTYVDAFGRRFSSSLQGVIAVGQDYQWERLPTD